MVKFESVQDQSTEEYFKGNQFSIDAFHKKYQAFPNETYVEALKGVCDYIASVEPTSDLQKYWSEQWFDEIYNDWWHPAGSIMQGARIDRNVSLSNCTTISLGVIDTNKNWDSLEGIIKNAAYTVAKCAAYRQGLGIDASALRPARAKVYNSSNESDGAIRWLSFIDSIGYYVGQKGRIPAMLFSLSISHPDIEEFITVKADYTKIQNANISVQNTAKFYKCVLNNEDFELRFEIKEIKAGSKVYIDEHSTDIDSLKDDTGYYYIAKKSRPAEIISKKISAVYLLELIAKNMTTNAEPGIQNIDVARKYSNSDYVYDPSDIYDSRIISSNACCFWKSRDVFVHTKNGLKEIQTVTSDDEVWCELHGCYAKTSGYFNAGIDDVYRVLHEFGELFITKNHKLWVHTNEYGVPWDLLELNEINVGDQLMTESGESPKILSIEYWDNGDVGCIEVPEYHYFTANNILSGNSEQYLSRESLCVLSSLNVAKFSTIPEQYELELSKVGRSINRFLDNVNECELQYKSYATPHQRIAIEKLRRTGAGYTNLAGWLFKKNLEYGTTEGNDAVAHFTERYNYYLYKSSIELGRDKGSFGLFRRDKFEKSPFVQRMMGLGLEFDAMRNVTVSSIAPTGTLSLMFRDTVLSYGIEQAFGIYYWKRTRISGKYEYYFCVPGVVRELFQSKGCSLPMESDTIKDTWDGSFGKPIAKFIDENLDKLGVRFKKAHEVTCMEKLDLMAKAMKWVDSSISVTYMLPEDSDWKDVYNFILEAYKREVKSIAAFPDRKMYGIVSYIPFKELAVKLLKDGVGIHPQNFIEDELKQLNLKSDTEIQKTNAIKRPKTLLCDISHSKVKGKDHTVLVGTLNNDPYEIMVICDHTHIKNEKGQITKVKRGHYNLLDESGNLLWENITEKSTENEDSLTRMTSTALRHGAMIDHVTSQLEKVRGAELQGFAKCLARSLKHYIKDDSKVTGRSCPSCQSENLVRADGCISCACGWSAC